MTVIHEEFEVGHELDRALRATVTGLAQIMERYARRSQDRSRSAAAQARQEWLESRDAARQQYIPWLREGTVEKASGLDASKAWAHAAAWSSMDPVAKSAEEQLAGRIKAAHGEHPSILIQQTDLSKLPEQPEATRMLTMPEVVDLANEHAPYYYTAHKDVQPSADVPTTPVEEKLHSDWQYFSESGVLPERSQWEAWAEHEGRAEEFAPEQWRTAAGEYDEESRDAALQQVWAEGAEERGIRDLEEHQVAMEAAGMGDLGAQVNPSAQPTWVPLMQQEAFDQASPAEITVAWRDARAKGATGDLAAQAAASQIGDHFRRKYSLNPDEYLIGAMTERAANNAESRRAAEDKARDTAEQTRPAPVPLPNAAPQAEAPGMTRERVVELNEQAQQYFAAQLRPGSKGHDYLVDRLGEGVLHGPWAIGYAPGGWTNLTRHLQRNGATDQEILGAGLGRRSSRGNVIDAFRDRAMVGIRNTDGELVGFVGRDLSGHERAPRYVNTGGTAAFTKSEQVFGLHEAGEGAKIVRTEAAFDAMAVTLAGDGDVVGVAPLGTALSDTQASMIAEKAGGRVWLANDNDPGGRAATEEDFYTFARHGVQTSHVPIPGDDPASAWQETPGLMRSTMATIDDAPPAGEVVIDRYFKYNEAGLRSGDAEARRGLDETVRGVTAAYDDPVEARLLAEQADTRLTSLTTAETPSQGQPKTQAGDLTRPTSTGSAEEWGRADAGEVVAYDRAAEANLENLTVNARDARVASSHGFSQSTSDMLAKTRSGKTGVQARPNRSTPTQRRGRGLNR